MSTEIRVPTLGESVSEATIAKWFKKPGDAVKADEPLLELETDKVTLEVNAPSSGVLAEIIAKDGETVAPGALLGQITAGAVGAATAAPAAKSAEPAKPAPAPAAAAPAAAKPATAMPPAPSAAITALMFLASLVLASAVRCSRATCSPPSQPRPPLPHPS